MKVKAIFALPFVLLLSGCNMLGFMDKPSGDQQLLDAARNCLDKGDFVCAKDYYQALSNNYLDVKISETSLTTLAAGNIFFMSDLFSALGDGTGGPSSILALTSTLAARSKTDAATRTIVQGTYSSDAAISDITLQAYSQFISSITMFSSVLANGITSGGKLTAANIAANPTTCAAAAATCAQGSLCVCAACNVGTGVGIVDAGGESGITMSTATNWAAPASYEKLGAAASAANTAIGTLTGSGGKGIFSTLQLLNGLGSAGDNCRRQILLNVLFFPTSS